MSRCRRINGSRRLAGRATFWRLSVMLNDTKPSSSRPRTTKFWPPNRSRERNSSFKTEPKRLVSRPSLGLRPKFWFRGKSGLARLEEISGAYQPVLMDKRAPGSLVLGAPIPGRQSSGCRPIALYRWFVPLHRRPTPLHLRSAPNDRRLRDRTLAPPHKHLPP